MSSSAPLVSVLVPLHGEPPDVVIATLESLLGLDHPAFEVIVVGSADDRAVAAFCESRGLLFTASEGPGPATLDAGLTLMDERSAVMMVVEPGRAVEPDLLAALHECNHPASCPTRRSRRSSAPLRQRT